MNKEKLPTAEDILYDIGEVYTGDCAETLYYHARVLKAMEEYKDLHTAPLRARIDDLEREVTEVNKQLIDTLTKDFEIAYENSELKKENERLQNTVHALGESNIMLNVKLDRVQTESNNKDLEIRRLREALEAISSGWERVSRGIAKEALKGKNNNVCEKCGYPTFKMFHENVTRCHGCDNIIELKGETK